MSGHVRWRRQPNWFIDGENLSGLASDRNDGHDITHPIRHWETMYRRLGPHAYLHDINMAVTVMSSLQAGDHAAIDVLIGPNCSVVCTGTKKTAGLPSGTFTTYTDVNRTVGAESMPKIADTALSGAGFSTSLNRLVKITGGARADTGFFLTKDLGSKTARMTTPVTIAAPALYTVATRKVPVATDPYQIYDLPVVPVGFINAQLATNNGIIDVTGGYVQFNSLDLDMGSSAVVWARGVEMAFVDSIIRNGFFDSDYWICGNCLFPGPNITVSTYGPFPTIQAGAAYGSPAFWTGAIITLDFDFLVQGGVIGVLSTGSRLLCGKVAFFDTVAQRSFQVTEGALWSIATLSDGAGMLWGTNNAGPFDVLGQMTMSSGSTFQLNQGLGRGREIRIGGTEKLCTELPYGEFTGAYAGATPF